MKHSTSKSIVTFNEFNDYSIMNISTKNRNMSFVIDREDVDRIKSIEWQICVTGKTKRYYARSILSINPILQIYLHQFIMSFPEGLVIDHINRDTLDNRKINLRAVTPYVNSSNRSKCKRKHFDLDLGVSHAPCNRFKASAGYLGKSIHLGTFDTQNEAHKAYCDFKKSIGIYID